MLLIEFCYTWPLIYCCCNLNIFSLQWFGQSSNKITCKLDVCSQFLSAYDCTNVFAFSPISPMTSLSREMANSFLCVIFLCSLAHILQQWSYESYESRKICKLQKKNIHNVRIVHLCDSLSMAQIHSTRCQWKSFWSYVSVVTVNFQNFSLIICTGICFTLQVNSRSVVLFL